MWEKGDLATKRCVLNTTFMHKISYDKESKFRTPELSPIFKMFSEFQGSKSNMVHLIGESWNQFVREMSQTAENIRACGALECLRRAA